MDSARLRTFLAYFGALPFIACALLLFSGYRQLPVLGDIAKILSAYGLVIASFMAGVHWGQYLELDKRAGRNLFISSNVAAIAVWFSYLILTPRWFLLALIIVFATLLAIDARLQRRGVLPSGYLAMRTGVSAVVAAALVLAMLSLPS